MTESLSEVWINGQALNGFKGAVLFAFVAYSALVAGLHLAVTLLAWFGVGKGVRELNRESMDSSS